MGLFNVFKKNAELLSKEDQVVMMQAIQKGEAKTSGEIRVFVESHCEYVDAMDRAKEIFYALGMQKTQARNAVLIYVALHDHQFALFGDEGIWQKTKATDFWKKEMEIAKQYFKDGKIAQGIAEVAKHIGLTLSVHFPADPSIDKNELPDEIVFGK